MPVLQITSFYNDEEGCIECSAMNHFAAGQQVAMFYGPRTTAEFLLYSGFVPTPNTYDTLSLVLGVSTRDKLFAKKQQVLKMVSMPITLSFKLPRDVSLLGLPVELVAFLRVYTSNEMELDVLAALSRERFTEHFQQDVGALASDKEWIKFLRMRCQLLAMKYKPGQAQPADVGDVAWALAETVKANEKQILDTYIAHLSRLANT
ncbi:hypothetical protein SARC_01691 [Sphaeroforma arctica JP610]|uniref:Rubisco LSMT substrate-binding domain-containing protein n=1 Tax=Sphaeroforma arctica JP610 TaxID=667725 RepID=A0A0L0GAZ4_9EUKA|nr:hypothetical protein SARC_01691 [Sphaeroforma arctica JP610]KNC86165.1 hypothetical protein SARC_01691 [Sphaeroforma arctica JP610]|eukprot:XP_014160067.1 hypothetical protein SARC_01691 [Sphaeroforma arctica JP610]